MVRGEALRAMALRCRRTGARGGGSYWERDYAAAPMPDVLLHEAIEALAIHHEHRSRDLDVARSFAERLTVHDARVRRHVPPARPACPKY